MEQETVKNFLQRLGACSEAIKWASSYDTIADAWDVCERGDWMEWLLVVTGYQWSAGALAEYERVRDAARLDCWRICATALREIIGNPFKDK